MKRVFAIDQALHTGWATDMPTGGGRPLCGVWDLKGGGADYEAAYVDLEERLLEAIAVHKPDVIVFESPLLVHGDKVITTEDTTRLSFGLASVAGLVAKREGLEPAEANNMTWKKHFVGNGRAKKRETQERCRLMGWGSLNNNAADACGIWAYAKAVLDPSFNYVTTPMFARASA
jgi:Holliday junction resolvasome RuvABC endonuclease subunit